MIAYEGYPPVPLMPRAIADLYVQRYMQHGPTYQARWLRQHAERGLGVDFTFEIYEAAETTLKDYFIDNEGNVSSDWAGMIANGTVDSTRLDFVWIGGVFWDGISGQDVLNALSTAWTNTPYKWPLDTTDFPQSGTQTIYTWIVWHMHWLFVLETLRSVSEFKWRLE